MYPLYEDMVLATCHYDISLQYEVPFLVLGFNVYIGHRNNENRTQETKTET